MHDLARGADLVAFADFLEGTQDDGADRVLLEVEGDAANAALKLEQLERLRAAETVDLGDPVSHLGDDPDVGTEDRDVEFPKALFDQAADLVRPDAH